MYSNFKVSSTIMKRGLNRLTAIPTAIAKLVGVLTTALPDGFKLNDIGKEKGLEYYQKKQELNDERMPHPKETYVLNGSLISDLLITHDLECGYTNVFDPYDWYTLGGQLLNLCREKHITLITVEERQTVTSGAHGTAQRTYDLLCEIEPIKQLFIEIETKFIIKHCFFVVYLENGHHPFHMDNGYCGTHRILISLGSIEKEMWFRKENGLDGIKVRHGSIVTLSKNGGGVGNSTISHSTRKTGKSMFLCLEVVALK